MKKIFLLLFLSLVILSTYNMTTPTEINGESSTGGYLFSYFKTDSEAMHYAISNDGLNWVNLNYGDPVLTATIGNNSIRDPHILRDQDGTFRLVSTNSWESRSILMWDSTDLINWSNQRLVEVAPSNANNAWAPQMTYDPINNNYMVYWSSRLDVNWHHRIYKATTTDFVNFSAPSILYETDYTVIDGDIVPNSDGTYTMIIKDERDDYKRMYSVTSSQVDGPYSNMSEAITPYGTEGPTTFKLTGENKWVMYYDFYWDGYFGASHTTDLVNWTTYGTEEFSLPLGVRHGSVLPITGAEMDALINAWGDPYHLALNQPVTYSSQQSGNEADHTVDGDLNTRWSAYDSNYPQWVQVDLGQTYSVNKTEIDPYNDRAYQYKIETSTDDINYTLAVDQTNNTTGGSLLTDTFTDVDARYVRLTVTGVHNCSGCWAGINEFRVFEGIASEPDTEAPTTPTNLAATAVSSSQIDLSWTASTDNIGVAGYKVYRDGMEIDTTSSTSYSDNGLASATSYSYTVQAYDHANNLSAQSSAASATTAAVSATMHVADITMALQSGQGKTWATE
jgi:hypothetical protein